MAFGDHYRGDMLDVPADEMEEPDGGKTRRVTRESSVKGALAHCRWAASAVVATGVPIEQLNSLKDLVVPLDRGRFAIRFLYQRNDGKASAAGMHVFAILRIIATHWAHLPKQEIEKIKTWGKNVVLNTIA